jgi:hypothetical protein
MEEADPAFQWPQKGPTFKEYLTAVHRKLGFCGSWQLVSFVESMTNRARTGRLNTHIHCDRDDAEESFLFTAGNDPRLRGYLITSRVLVTS